MRFEITFLARPDEGSSMVLMDRCTIDAEDTEDAARKYAALFLPESRATRRPVITWEDIPGRAPVFTVGN